MLMVEPLLTVRDFRAEAAQLGDEVADAGELLRNYEFNISQGIVQRVSRFSDALALMDERGEAPPARGEGREQGGEGGDSARGGVMGFSHKRNVCNLEKKPARRVAWEQQERERLQKEVAAAALKATEQDAQVAALEAKVAAAAALKATEQDKMAALEAKVADMQVCSPHTAALRPCLALPPPHPSHTSAHFRTLHILPPCAPSARRQYVPPPHLSLLCRSSSVHEPHSRLRIACATLGRRGARVRLWPPIALADVYERRHGKGKTEKGGRGACHCLAVWKFELRAGIQ